LRQVAWNLLIVEDDDDISESLYDIFEARGYFVWRAGNGREAIEIARREAFHPDVILLDLRMPVMDGVEFLRARSSVPLLATSHVIVMTAQPGVLDEIEDAVFERLAKPLRLEQVLEAVQRACDAPIAASR
jgi:CheY-like chemotaxis protein